MFTDRLPAFENMLTEFVANVEERKGEPIKWAGWIESQENGNQHAHLLVDAWIDHNRLQPVWNECGEGND